MKNDLRLILKLIDIKEELKNVGEEELSNKINKIILDLEKDFSK